MVKSVLLFFGEKLTAIEFGGDQWYASKLSKELITAEIIPKSDKIPRSAKG